LITFRFPSQVRSDKGFTLIELMVALAIVGILSLLASQSMLQNQKNSRKNDFDNEINAAMAELTRLTTDPVTCFSTLHDLGPGNSDYSQEANKFNHWTKVPYFIYDSNISADVTSNLIAHNFPLDGSQNGSAPAFRGSKILGIRSAYIAPHNYPNYALQENVGPPDFKGNAFVVITFEYIGPPNTMIGMKTRTKVLPLSVTWAKKIVAVAAANETAAQGFCSAAAASESCTPTACSGNLTSTCDSSDSAGAVICSCAIFQSGRTNWKIRECNSVSGT
jgi:prepilin-type N-terminal cleavage/methylation domain-containing protein